MINCFDTTGKLPLQPDTIVNKVEQLLKSENIAQECEIRIIFVDDARIRSLNKKYLGHDYETDVIAFPLEEEKDFMEGEVYVSMERGQEQAKEFRVSLREELLRLVFHGVLHLVGYDDQDTTGRLQMQEKENYYLRKLE